MLSVKTFAKTSCFLTLANKLCRFSSSSLSESFYNEEQHGIQKTVRKIIDVDINPFVDEWERRGEYPAHKIFKKFGDAGLLGIHKPLEYGGLGLDFTYHLAMLEALGNVNCGGIPVSIAVQTDMSTPALMRFGSHELKSEFLAPSIRGDVVSAVAVSEPGAGSDVAGIRTSAKRVGDDLVINGEKMWITNAYQADWVCLLANTTTDRGPHLNKTLICVPMETKGITLTKKLDKLGFRSSDTGIIYFEDVRVPAKNIIGEEGMGFTYQMMQFQEERLAAAAISLMAMDNIISETIQYTQTRKIFGAPVLDNQYVHFKLAELKTEVEMLRAAVYQTAKTLGKNQDVTELASMIKLKVGRLSREVADGCLQFWGGMGFTNEVNVSRYYRDCRVGSIGGGSDETMLSIICKYMSILPKKSK